MKKRIIEKLTTRKGGEQEGKNQGRRKNKKIKEGREKEKKKSKFIFSCGYFDFPIAKY